MRKKPKKKHTPPWKIFLVATSSIAVFLLTSTLFDILQGDSTPSRILTLKICIIIFISVLIVLGIHKGINMLASLLKNQLGG